MMKKPDIRLLEEGYLYQFSNGEIKEFKGEVWYDHNDTEYYSPFQVGGDFIIRDEKGRKIKKYACWCESGRVYKDVLVLYEWNEPSIHKAAQYFIDNREEEKAKLEYRVSNTKLKIENYETQIKRLKELL